MKWNKIRRKQKHDTQMSKKYGNPNPMRKENRDVGQIQKIEIIEIVRTHNQSVKK